MDYVLLSAEEASQLVGVPSQDIIARVEAGELSGMRVAGRWRIPLKTVAQLLAARATNEPEALEALFNDQELWDRVFAAHPEVSGARAVDENSVGGVRSYLRGAIGRARPGSDDQEKG